MIQEIQVTLAKTRKEKPQDERELRLWPNFYGSYVPDELWGR